MNKKILIMGGGTGGHVFPGLAVAHYFNEQKHSVYWMGTKLGIEATLVPNAGFPIYFIDIKGLRGKGMFSLFLAPWRLLHAILQAIKIIRHIQPDVVLGMGGFVSGPGGIASWLLRKKLVIHEQNAKSGLTNRWLAKIATRVLEGFPNTFTKRQSVVTTGNPVRKEIALIPPPRIRLASRNMLDKQDSGKSPFISNHPSETLQFDICESVSEFEARQSDALLGPCQPLALCSSVKHNNLLIEMPRLLVLGGSLGAQAINEILPRTLAKIPAEKRPIVYHQAGEKHFDQTVQAYSEAKVIAEVVPFIKEIDKAYAWADFVICRAGALTIAELCAAGVGAILIPFPHAVDDHQTANANYMVNYNAAFLVQQAVLSEELLKQKLDELCFSAEKRMHMAEAAYKLRQVDAVEKVCREVCQ